MNLNTIKEKGIYWLFDAGDTQLPLYQRALRRIARVLFAVIRDLINGQLTLHAMGLVYTTILSIVPLLALSFSVLKAFNVHDKFTPMLYRFLEPMGEKGLEIQQNVLNFVDNVKVGVLGTLGFLILFYTVISLVQKIERSFNMIWYAPDLRSLSQRFSNYLSVILVGPVLIVAALSFTASMMSSSLVQSLIEIEPFGTLILGIGKLMPFLLIITAFTFFYVLMPNTKVKFGSALVGGVVAGISWQATSLLFTSFVVSSTKYDAIYSGFAVGILLLIWLYANWLILLIGSSIAFYHQNGNQITPLARVKTSANLTEQVGLDVMLQVGTRYEDGVKPISQTELEQMHHIPGIMTREVVDKLLAHGLLLVAGDKSECLAPGRSTDKITIADILEALRQDDSQLMRFLVASPSVKALHQSFRDDLHDRFSAMSLRDLIDQREAG